MKKTIKTLEPGKAHLATRNGLQKIKKYTNEHLLEAPKAACNLRYIQHEIKKIDEHTIHTRKKLSKKYRSGKAFLIPRKTIIGKNELGLVKGIFEILVTFSG